MSAIPLQQGTASGPRRLPLITDEWTPLPKLRAAFEGSSDAAREKAAQRWARSLPRVQRRIAGKTTEVRGDARLPNQLQVIAYLRVPMAKRLDGRVWPEGCELWSESEQQRFLDTHKLLDWWDAHAKAMQMPEADAARSFGLQLVDDAQGKITVQAWASVRGLSLSHRSLCRYRRRVTRGTADFDGNVDRRGRPDDSSASACSDAAWEFFLDLYHDQNKPDMADCWRTVKGCAMQPDNAWDWPSLDIVRRLYKRRVKRADEIIARDGLQKFKALAEPKLPQNIADVPAGDWWVGDQRRLDVQCGRQTAHGWQTFRPVVTAWIDRRSRYWVGWTIGPGGNSDTILAALKHGARQHGLPATVTIDNGKDYDSLGRTLKDVDRRWEDFNEQRIGSVWESMKIDARYAEIRSPWAKIIERHFDEMKEGCDKLLLTFRGGSPGERPERAAEVAADPASMPTLDQVRAHVASWMQLFHSEAQRGDGMFGLTPNLVMERYRGVIRRADPVVLDLICAKITKALPVRRDGVTHDGVVYGRGLPAMMDLLGREVRLRLDPETADAVMVCDLAGRPMFRAHSDAAGIDRQDLRDFMRDRRRRRKQAREYAANRKFLGGHTAAQILEFQRATAQAREDQLRASLPPAEEPTVRIVRPDVAADVSRIDAQERAEAARRARTGTDDLDSIDDCPPPAPRAAYRSAAELLADDEDVA